MLETERTRGLQGFADARLDLAIEHVDAQMISVYFSRDSLPVGTIAMIALGGQHRGRGGDHPILRMKPSTSARRG